jgi:hypothetical protein
MRSYSCSQFVATTDVKPLLSTSAMSSSCAEPPERSGGVIPRITHACIITGGAITWPWTLFAATSGCV